MILTADKKCPYTAPKEVAIWAGIIDLMIKRGGSMFVLLAKEKISHFPLP